MLPISGASSGAAAAARFVGNRAAGASAAALGPKLEGAALAAFLMAPPAPGSGPLQCFIEREKHALTSRQQRCVRVECMPMLRVHGAPTSTSKRVCYVPAAFKYSTCSAIPEPMLSFFPCLSFAAGQVPPVP